jgi:Bacterial archaeo-eukaryotic release factor family 3
MKKPLDLSKEPTLLPGPLDAALPRELAGMPTPPLVTVYLPMEREFPEVKQNVVRLRHAAEKVREKLLGFGLEEGDARAGAERILSVETDTRRLDAPVAGIAIFLDRTDLRACTLPWPVDEQVRVTDHYVLRPLLRQIDLDRPYRLLALSSNRLVLYEGDARGIRPALKHKIPASLDEALNLIPKPAAFRSRTESLSRDYAGGVGEREVDLLQFHRIVGRALEALPNPQIPIVLAADITTQGEFRKIVQLPSLLREGVLCNPDPISPDTLHARAWPIVEAEGAAARKAVINAFEHARNRGKGLDLLDDVVQAALAGRIRRLLLEASRRVPGRIDQTTGRCVPSDEPDADVLDALCAIVLARGGEVIVAEVGEMPTDTGVAAELR